MNDVYDKMEEYSKNLEPGSEAGLFIGVAIVVLSNQKSQFAILKSQEKSFFSSFCFNSKDSQTGYTFERAPEPSDVYWENLNVTSMQRYVKSTWTFCVTVLMIAACFGIIYGINIAKGELDKVKDINKDINRALSFVCSFVIIIVNTLLKTVVRTLSVKE